MLATEYLKEHLYSAVRSPYKYFVLRTDKTLGKCGHVRVRVRVFFRGCCPLSWCHTTHTPYPLLYGLDRHSDSHTDFMAESPLSLTPNAYPHPLPSGAAQPNGLAPPGSHKKGQMRAHTNWNRASVDGWLGQARPGQRPVQVPCILLF